MYYETVNFNTVKHWEQTGWGRVGE